MGFLYAVSCRFLDASALLLESHASDWIPIIGLIVFSGMTKEASNKGHGARGVIFGLLALICLVVCIRLFYIRNVSPY
jgi:hypothetical protein